MFRRALGYMAVPVVVVATALVGAFGDDGAGRMPVSAVRVTEGTAVPITRTAGLWQSPTPSPTRRPVATAPSAPVAPVPTVPPAPTPADAGDEEPYVLKFVVAKTGGEGAVLRPAPAGGEMIRGWVDGTVMVQVGPDREVKGKIWKNLRDPEGNEGWIIGDFLAPAN